MLTFIFGNIGKVFVGLWLFCVACCRIIGTNTSINCAIFLGVLVYPAWNPLLWDNPSQIGLYHFVVAIAMCAFFEGKMGAKLALMTFFMLLADVIYVYAPELPLGAPNSSFPFGHFWWHSILNLLFLSQCIIILTGCWRTYKEHREANNGSVHAKSPHTAR